MKDILLNGISIRHGPARTLLSCILFFISYYQVFYCMHCTQVFILNSKKVRERGYGKTLDGGNDILRFIVRIFMDKKKL